MAAKGSVAKMLESIRLGFSRTANWTGLAAPSPEVEAAMRRVPREDFVPPDVRRRAYEDRALDIGFGATISQPFIVALMTSLLEIREDSHVLEVGTGSGYQAAILAELGATIDSLEIVPELRHRSARILAKYAEVHVHGGDGWCGLAARAPFDRIIVTACATEVPEALRDELARGGRMVLPVDSGQPQQELVLVTKEPGGRLQQRTVLPVAFVPMVGRGR